MPLAYGLLTFLSAIVVGPLAGPSSSKFIPGFFFLVALATFVLGLVRLRTATSRFDYLSGGTESLLRKEVLIPEIRASWTLAAAFVLLAMSVVTTHS